MGATLNEHCSGIQGTVGKAETSTTSDLNRIETESSDVTVGEVEN